MGSASSRNAPATDRDEDGGAGCTRRKGLPMTTSNRWILGLARVRPGDRIEAWEHRRTRFTGTVSEVVPQLGIAWVLEDRTGLRRLVSVRDHRLRRSEPVTTA
jgi:hypothetical protein